MTIAFPQSPSIARGDVFWVDFGWPDGSVLHGFHPGVVISSDRYNANPRNRVIRFIPLTTLRRPARHDELVIAPPNGGVRHASLARIVQARPVDRSCIYGRLGRVSDETMEKIEELILETSGIAFERTVAGLTKISRSSKPSRPPSSRRCWPNDRWF